MNEISSIGCNLQVIYGNESENPNELHASIEIEKHFTAGNKNKYVTQTGDFCGLENYLIPSL